MGARALPVVSDRVSRRLVGVVTRLELLTMTSTKSGYKVSDIMSEPTLELGEFEDVPRAARLMLRLDEWYVPVVSSGRRLVGMLGLENVIAALLHFEPKVQLSEALVEGYMSTDVVYVDPEDDLREVWYLMLKHKYSGLPVVNEGRVIGVITQYDLLSKGRARIRLESESKPLRVKVREVMSRPAITVGPKEKLVVAAERLVRLNIGRLVVADERLRLLGMFDRSDAVRGILEVLGA